MIWRLRAPPPATRTSLGARSVTERGLTDRSKGLDRLTIGFEHRHVDGVERRPCHEPQNTHAP